jgi:drug/metabolite transporter (DMT)-like permease
MRKLTFQDTREGDSPILKATLQALFVTFLWSSSWVLIKIGLGSIPPLTFAGLRYGLAFLILLAIYLRSPNAKELSQLERADWFRLGLLGVIFYSITQGAQFLGLLFLPAITFSLLLNFSALLIALLGSVLLKEKLSGIQWLGIVISLIGGLLFFYPLQIPELQVTGFLVAALALSANSISSVLGRSINRTQKISAMTVTVVSMGFGGSLLLISGLATQGLPSLDLREWGIVVWLAAVNTAWAFTLWNQSLRVLSAAQSSIINNTMLVQITLLAWLFLGESISRLEAVGMSVALLGSYMVQVREKKIITLQ